MDLNRPTFLCVCVCVCVFVLLLDKVCENVLRTMARGIGMCLYNMILNRYIMNNNTLYPQKIFLRKVARNKIYEPDEL